MRKLIMIAILALLPVSSVAQAVPILTAVRNCPRIGSIEVQVYPAGENVWVEGAFRNNEGLIVYMERECVNGSGTKTIFIEYDHPLVSGSFELDAWCVTIYSSSRGGNELFSTGWQNSSWRK